MLVSKLLSGTSKTKASQGGLVRVALFWKSHCATCSLACVILHHVIGSCKGPIGYIHGVVSKRVSPLDSVLKSSIPGIPRKILLVTGICNGMS